MLVSTTSMMVSLIRFDWGWSDTFIVIPVTESTVWALEDWYHEVAPDLVLPLVQFYIL
jgi:hypothetical protein